MSRLVYSVMFAFSLSVLSISAVGCGGADNEVIEDTRTEADIDQEEADYEEMMEDTEASDVSE
jgi:hypothetical protein